MNWFRNFFSKLASGGSSPSPAVESVRQPTFVTITEFETVPKRVVVGGSYHSRKFAETAAAVARAQLGSFVVPYSVRVEQSPMSSSSTPSTVIDSDEAKPK